jgi:hypothetical protein
LLSLQAEFYLLRFMLRLRRASSMSSSRSRTISIKASCPCPQSWAMATPPHPNLCWGAAFGVKTFFRNSKDWQTIGCAAGPRPAILKRCIFKYRTAPAYLVADAYQGVHLSDAVSDFLNAAAGRHAETVIANSKEGDVSLAAGGKSDLVVYVGHDGPMDFRVDEVSTAPGTKSHPVIILACASKICFASYLKPTGATPLLWTRGVMAPEAYTLKAALDGWIANQLASDIQTLAAQAYDKYPHCGAHAASHLFATGG